MASAATSATVGCRCRTPSLSRNGLAGSMRLGRGGRNREIESAPETGSTIDPDMPSVRFDDALDDRETETHPVAHALPRLPEPIEQVLAALGVEPGASIRDPELDGPTLRRRGSEGDAPTRRCEVDRIGDEVREYLLESVAVDPNSGKLLHDVDLKLERRGRDEGPLDFRDAVNDLHCR